jgi:hypothetical protein
MRLYSKGRKPAMIGSEIEVGHGGRMMERRART